MVVFEMWIIPWQKGFCKKKSSLNKKIFPLKHLESNSISVELQKLFAYFNAFNVLTQHFLWQA